MSPSILNTGTSPSLWHQATLARLTCSTVHAGDVTHVRYPCTSQPKLTHKLCTMRIALQIKANLENVTNLRAEGTDFRWYLKFQCGNCQEESKSFQYVTLQETAALKGGRGSANLVSKCKLCSRENSVAIVPESLTSYNLEDSNRFKQVVAFECRGMTPVEFSPRTGFACDGADSSSKFDVDLGEGEWVDYDEDSQESVGIYEFESKFMNLK